MKPSVTVGDAEREMIDALLAAGLSNVSSSFPSTPLTQGQTATQVEQESAGVTDYPVTERAQVRVAFYAAKGQRTAVKALAATGLAALYRASSASVAGVVPLLGRSSVTTDPDTSNVMCWVLVRVDLKASLAS